MSIEKNHRLAELVKNRGLEPHAAKDENFGPETILGVDLLLIQNRAKTRTEAFKVLEGLDFEQTMLVIDGLSREQVTDQETLKTINHAIDNENNVQTILEALRKPPLDANKENMFDKLAGNPVNNDKRREKPLESKGNTGKNNILKNNSSKGRAKNVRGLKG